jgi:hypothetical protein
MIGRRTSTKAIAAHKTLQWRPMSRPLPAVRAPYGKPFAVTTVPSVGLATCATNFSAGPLTEDACACSGPGFL